MNDTVSQVQKPLNYRSTGHQNTGLLLVLGLPILLLVIFPLAALIFGVSPRLIGEYLEDDLTQKALWLSLKTSVISTAIIILFGTPLASLLSRSKFPGRGALEMLLQLAIVVPPAVAGIGLLMAFGRNGFVGHWLRGFGIEIPFTATAVIMAQCFVACPYFIRTAAVALESIDPHLSEVARLDGASNWQIFRHVQLPLAWRGFVGGAAMSWARALGEFGATIIFAGNYPGRTQTLPLAVYLGFETGLDRALVLAVILLSFSFIFLLVIHFLTARSRE